MSSSDSEMSDDEYDEAPPPLYRAADYYFDALELGADDSEEAEALYRQAIALLRDGLAPAVPQAGCPVRLPAVPASEAEQGAGQLPPSAVLVSAAHNAVGELLLDRALAGRGGLRAPRTEFEAALRWWPENAAAATSLATMERDGGHFAAAVALFERIAALPLLPESTDGDGDGDGDSGYDGWVEDWVAQPRRACVPVANLMLALLRSQLGCHADALEPIQRFGFKHRISPKVWQAAHSRAPSAGAGAGAGKSSLERDCCPVHLYKDVVPPGIGAILSEALAPGAAYWKETGYDTREYFSWFIDLREHDRRQATAAVAAAAAGTGDAHSGAAVPPVNVVEELVLLLRPLVERSLPAGEKMVGAEWWTHSRPKGRNVGHQLHYDLEEGILETRGEIVHPAVSSVIYLSDSNTSPPEQQQQEGQRQQQGADVDAAGPTLVLDQRVHDDELATRAWLSHPVQGAMLTFPGDRLHGVLPGRPAATATAINTAPGINTAGELEATAGTDASGGGGGSSSSAESDQDEDEGEEDDEVFGLGRKKETERLTLMIAWWSVPTRELLCTPTSSSSSSSSDNSNGSTAATAATAAEKSSKSKSTKKSKMKKMRRALIGPQAILPQRSTRRFTFPDDFTREHYRHSNDLKRAAAGGGDDADEEEEDKGGSGGSRQKKTKRSKQQQGPSNPAAAAAAGGAGSGHHEELPVVVVDQPWETLSAALPSDQPNPKPMGRRSSTGNAKVAKGKGSKSGGGDLIPIPHHIDQRFFVFDAQTVTARLFAEHQNMA